MFRTLLFFTLLFSILKSEAQNVYKTAYTYIGKTKTAVIQAKGSDYETSNDGDIFYEYKNATGIQPGAVRYSFTDGICIGVVMFYNPQQKDAVTAFLNKSFSYQEVKIPGTELYSKLWIQTENSGRYTWSLTDKGDAFFLSILFYKK